MQTKLSRLWEIVRFCIAGAAGVIAYYAVLYYLTEYLKLWHVYSAVVGLVVNQAVNFVLQKYWTFKNTDAKEAPRQAAQYFLMGAILSLANILLLYLFADMLHIWYMGAQIGITVF